MSIKCPKCNGTKISRTIKCAVCHGKGKGCIFCKGTGKTKEKCYLCNGAGYIKPKE